MVGPGSSWLYLLGVIAILSIALSAPNWVHYATRASPRNHCAFVYSGVPRGT